MLDLRGKKCSSLIPIASCVSMPSGGVRGVDLVMVLQIEVAMGLSSFGRQCWQDDVPGCKYKFMMKQVLYPNSLSR